MTQTADNPEGGELTDAQKRELDKRLAAYEASGYKGDSWENVVERIRAKRDTRDCDSSASVSGRRITTKTGGAAI